MTSVPWRSPVVWGVPLIALALLTLLVATGTNRAVFAGLNGWSRITGPELWPFVTVLGDTAVALTLFLPFALRRPDVLWALAVSAVLATLFVHGLKPIFDEPRPPAVLSPESIAIIGAPYRAHSFPSGHTTTIFVAAALIWLHFTSPWMRAIALAIATLVGLSRAVVGVHWPVDIAAGMAGGWIAACLGTSLARRWRFGLRTPVQTLLVAIGVGCAVALLAGLKTGYPMAIQFQYAVGAAALASLCFAAFARINAILNQV
jgi:membrane-associated phospholipid phosphatase